jgi:allophanate hydrolase subunit 2
MSKLVISAIGPASSVQDGGRHGAQRYGLTPSGAMDRLALAAANCLVGNVPFTAAIEIGPFGAALTAREGAVRVALAGASRNADVAGRAVASDTSMTLADGETLTLGFARALTARIRARCRRATNCRRRPRAAPQSAGSIYQPLRTGRSAW